MTYQGVCTVNEQLNIDIIRKQLRRHTVTLLDREDLTRAAVLIPLVNTGDGLDLLFTVRTDEVEHHKGQISFPGGAMEPGDKSVEDTAIRESREELSIIPEDVDIFGRLDDVWTPTGFVVAPITGYLAQLPDLRPEPREVSDFFLAPLSFFLDDSNVRTEVYQYEGEPRKVWFYEYGEYTIWGITASIIRLFLNILR